MSCTCGLIIELAGSIVTTELGGIRHRKDGPCYDIEGGTVVCSCGHELEAHDGGCRSDGCMCNSFREFHRAEEMIELLTPLEETEALAGHILTAALVRPGDTLVISFDHPVTTDDCERCRRNLMGAMRGLSDVVVLAECHVSAVYRPDDRPPATIDADGR